jgi:hypothetical protein
MIIRNSIHGKRSSLYVVFKAALLVLVLLLVVSCRESSPGGASDSNSVDSAGGTSNTKSGNVPIQFEFPRPVFEGTEKNIDVPNLEPFSEDPYEPFLAPVGTKNVALGRPVTSSSGMPIFGELEMITDGDKEATEGSCVDLGIGLQHITIDLGSTYNIYAMLFWHYHSTAKVYFDVIVQVADDADFTVNVQTIFNNDIDNSAGFGVGADMHYVESAKGKLIDAKGIKGRYVRLYSNGSKQSEINHYIEVEVFGKPAQ